LTAKCDIGNSRLDFNVYGAFVFTAAQFSISPDILPLLCILKPNIGHLQVRLQAKTIKIAKTAFEIALLF